MRPKVTISTAGAERLGLSDADLCSLFEIDLSTAVPSDGGSCPACHNAERDNNFSLSLYEPSTEVSAYEGSQYVGCVCGTLYTYHFRLEQHF